MSSDCLLVTCQIPHMSLGEANLVLEEGARWGIQGHLNGGDLVFEMSAEIPCAQRVLALIDGTLAGRHASVNVHPAHGPPVFAGSYHSFAEGVRS